MPMRFMMLVLLCCFAAAVSSCDDQSSATSPDSEGGILVGSLRGGGVVFSVRRDSAGQQHGLIVSTVNMSGGADWETARRQCLDFTGGGYDDWYLPDKSELKILYDSRDPVNSALVTISGSTSLKGVFWSSTEFSSASAWRFSFLTGGETHYIKDGTHDVRAVRRF